MAKKKKKYEMMKVYDSVDMPEDVHEKFFVYIDMYTDDTYVLYCGGCDEVDKWLDISFGLNTKSVLIRL